jgi:trk system potassium uptake protein TrkH
MILVRISKEDLKVILRDLGSILFVVGYVLLLPLAVALIYEEKLLYFAFIYPSMAAIWTGFFLKKLFRGAEETRLKHAIINAALVYLLVPLIGSFPFLHYGFSFLDSYFESVSGFTTTGLTMIGNVEAMPKSLLFWRASTQWVGGVGVIMLFLVVLLETRAVIKRFYFAEGRTDRIKPAISTTANYIWRIYLLYTAIGIVLYYLAGMGLFDAVSHTFTALSTAGFSTKNSSIGSYGSISIEAVSIFLMLLGGISFVVHYKVLSGERSEFWRNPEVRTYFGIISISTLIVAFDLNFRGLDAINSFRCSVFQVVSALTTTGFSTVSISVWSDFSKAILTFLMISGGCVGSTSGGIKILRTLVLLKLSNYEIMRAILPERAVIPFKIRGKVLEDEEILRIASFFFLYISIVFISSLIISMWGYNFLDTLFITSSAQGSVGLTSLTPEKWLAMPSIAKSILIFEMWIGRLEIFPALALISALLIAIRREQIST